MPPEGQINPDDPDPVRFNSGENRDVEGEGPTWEIRRDLAEGERYGSLDSEHMDPKGAL